jgi:hypothetical protein
VVESLDLLARLAAHHHQPLLVRGVLEEIADLDPQGVGDLDQGGDGRGAAVVFDLRQGRLGEPGAVGHRLEGQAALETQLPDLGADVQGRHFFVDIFQRRSRHESFFMIPKG